MNGRNISFARLRSEFGFLPRNMTQLVIYVI